MCCEKVLFLTPSLVCFFVLFKVGSALASNFTSRQFLVCFLGGGVPSCLNPDLDWIHTPSIHTSQTDRPTDGQNSLQETFELVLETSNFVDLLVQFVPNRSGPCTPAPPECYGTMLRKINVSDRKVPVSGIICFGP